MKRKIINYIEKYIVKLGFIIQDLRNKYINNKLLNKLLFEIEYRCVNINIKI